MNRGAAKRPVFESREDVRTFLAAVGRAVRRGEIEVHAYCLLLNHFHLLVRSPRGSLSAAMRRITNSFVRSFNRRRRRDGPLFRGRFTSRVVESLAYRRALVRYIDDNPVRAGMAATAEHYPWCSAAKYATRRGPPWLERAWVEAVVTNSSGEEYAPRHYSTVFPSKVPEAVRAWIERRLCLDPNGDQDPLDQLLAASSEAVQDQMARRLRRADGRHRTDALLPVEVVRAGIARERRRGREWKTLRGRHRVSAVAYAEAGLLSSLCALSFAELAGCTGVPKSTAASRTRIHKVQIKTDVEYARRCAEISAEALSEFARLIH